MPKLFVSTESSDRIDQRVRLMQRRFPDEAVRVYRRGEDGLKLIDVRAPFNRYYGDKVDHPASS